uniref:Ig-like domain-containing protein n=1 Tax=Astyanax mexicanus TaxID=7994 RepID=A0A8B9GXJ4_ASTMX
VSGEAPVFSRELQEVSAANGEDATFCCELSQPGLEVSWFKDGKSIRKSQKYEIVTEQKVVKLIVRNVSAKDSGEYSCEATRGLTSKAKLEFKALPALFIQELKNQKAVEGESVTWSCELSKSSSAVQWRKGEVELCSCAKYEFKQDGHHFQLIIHNLEPEDSGEYTCDSGDRQSTARLAVQGRSTGVNRRFHDFITIMLIFITLHHPPSSSLIFIFYSEASSVPDTFNPAGSGARGECGVPV